jgi:hypothetical protein
MSHMSLRSSRNWHSRTCARSNARPVISGAGGRKGLRVEKTVWRRTALKQEEAEMGKYVKQVGCTVIGLTFVLLGTPVAQADNASFLAGARALGLNEADDVLIRTALSACRFLQPNLRRDPAEVEGHIVRHLNLDPGSIPDPSRGPIPEPDGHKFLILSVNEYCPPLAYRLSA